MKHWKQFLIHYFHCQILLNLGFIFVLPHTKVNTIDFAKITYFHKTTYVEMGDVSIPLNIIVYFHQ